MAERNPYAELARARKVHALVSHFDLFMHEAGLHDSAGAGKLVRALERMTADVWAAHASAAGCAHPPGKETRAAVIAVYAERAMRPGAAVVRAGAVAVRVATGLVSAAVALSVAGCGGRVEPQSEACPAWATYTLPPTSCLFAVAEPGEGLSTFRSAAESCAIPVRLESATAAYNTDPTSPLTVSVYCSTPGACSVRVVSPETDGGLSGLDGRGGGCRPRPGDPVNYVSSLRGFGCLSCRQLFDHAEAESELHPANCRTCAERIETEIAEERAADFRRICFEWFTRSPHPSALAQCGSDHAADVRSAA